MQARIIDSSPGGPTVEQAWEFDRPRIPLRELIRLKVRRELEQLEPEPPRPYGGLVPVSETERLLNGDRPEQPPALDEERQFLRALDAFRKNGFVVIASGRQLESLDEEVDLTGEVEFIRLAPLTGG